MPSAMPAARQSTRRSVIDGRAPRARARAAASTSANTGGISSATRNSCERPAAQHAVARDEVGRAEAGGRAARCRRPAPRAALRCRHGRGSRPRADRSCRPRSSGPGREPSRPMTRRAAADERGLIAVHDRRDEAGDLPTERGQPHVGRRPRRAAPALPCAASRPRAGGGPSPESLQHERAVLRPIARRAMPGAQREARPAGAGRARARRPTAAVVPSTDANTSEVCVTLPTSVRASSTSAPVPEPLSFAPGPGGRSSRPAMKTSASRELPLAADDAEHVDHRHRPPVGVRRAEALQVTSAPAARSRSATQLGRRDVARAARRAVGEARRRARPWRASACAPSNVGGSELRGSAGAVRAPTSSTKAGMSTTSQPAR